jgi:hypothetical protein
MSSLQSLSRPSHISPSVRSDVNNSPPTSRISPATSASISNTAGSSRISPSTSVSFSNFAADAPDESKVQLDGAIAKAISDAVQQQLKGLSSKLDAVLSLPPTSSKPTKSPKPSGLVSALAASHGLSPPTASSSAPAAAASPQFAGDVDGDEDDADEDQPAAAAPTASTSAAVERFAPVVIANAKASGGSVLQWVNAQPFNHTRTKHEAVAIAAALDAFIAEGIDLSSDGIEILCRRLSGIHTADRFNNWDLCKAVEWPYSSESLLGERLMSRAVKDASALSRIRDRASSKPSSKSFNRRSFNQSKPSNQNQSSFSKKSGVGSRSAGAAQH